MEKQTHTIIINATRERVWNVLWNEVTYMSWSSVFSSGSRAETDWKKGSKVLFVNSDNDGMAGIIAENIPHELMSIKHVAEVKKGIEQPESAASILWAGALENYVLKTVDGQTELTVEIDTTRDYTDYFAGTWPRALQRIKELAERA